MSVILETTVGDITIDLYLEERPRTCLNFLKLCKVKYYNYCLIHYVERNFMVQMGDPTSTGRGGESIFGMLYGDQAKYFEPELVPKLKHQKVGTLSMVNNGSNMHGSQFFITTSEDLDYLDGVHTVFGEVVEGMEVLMKINDSICDEQNRPYKDIRLSHTVILDDPFDDPPGLEVPPMSPEPTEEQLKSDRIGAHEDIDETEGKSMEEIQEEIKDKEAKARATILEMVGDLPDADVKPPENVLFICKLNPVTTDEDLEIIFSRFGKISSCEIIRDKKTGDSLQYAFIEFENEADCENAYFKMDNVLIDDRRIHVDFSQSVAKLTWMGKGRGVVDNRNKQEKEASKFTFKSTARSQGNYEMVFDDELPEENLIKDIKKLKKKSKDKNYDEKSSGKDKSSARYDEKSSGRYDEKSSGRYDEKSSGRYDDKSSGRYDDKSSARYDEKSSARYDEKSSARYDDKSSGRYDDKSSGRYYDYDRQKKFVNDREKSYRKEFDRSRDRELYSERSDRHRDSDRHSRFERDSSDSYKKHSSSDRYRDRYSRYEKNSDDYKKHFSSERDRDIDRYRYDKDSSYSYKKYSSDNRKSHTRERSKERRRHESSDDSYDSDYKSRSKRYSETSRKEDSRRRKSRT